MSKSRHLKWIIISFAFILFISSVGPWSVYKTSESRITNDIINSMNLKARDKDGKYVVDTAKFVRLDSLKTAQISNKIDYLNKTFGETHFKNLFKQSDYKYIVGHFDLLDWDYKHTLGAHRSIYYYFDIENVNIETNLSDYKTLLILDGSISRPILFRNKHYIVKYNYCNIQVMDPGNNTIKTDIRLEGILKPLLNKKDEDHRITLKSLQVNGINYKLVINDITLVNNTIDSLKISKINANLLLK